MDASWDKSTGRMTFEDGRFIILTGDDIDGFDARWCLLKTAEAREDLLKQLIRSKRMIHYPGGRS